MRCIASFLVGCALAISAMARPDKDEISYNVQLIRATDAAEPLPGSRPAGSRLVQLLHGPLKWKHYWSICERKVSMKRGRAKRVPLLNAREVEIDLTVQNQRTVTAFQNGKIMSRSAVPVGEGFSLLGGERDQDSGWFILVRSETAGD
jgi:hypothetical protein